MAVSGRWRRGLQLRASGVGRCAEGRGCEVPVSPLQSITRSRKPNGRTPGPMCYDARTKEPSRVLERNRELTSVPSTCSHVGRSRFHSRCAWAVVRRSPGISRYSPRILRSVSSVTAIVAGMTAPTDVESRCPQEPLMYARNGRRSSHRGAFSGESAARVRSGVGNPDGSGGRDARATRKRSTCTGNGANGVRKLAA